MRWLLICPVAIMVTANTSCRNNDARTAAHAWHGRTDTAGAIPVIINPAEPVFGAADASLETEWTVELQPDSSVDWVAPDRLLLLNDTTFVLDRAARRIAVFDAAGRQVRAFGARGAGPGEFEGPFGLARWNNDLAIGDGRLGLVKRFTTGGQYVSAMPIPILTLQILGSTSSRLLVQSLEPENRNGGSRVLTRRPTSGR